MATCASACWDLVLDQVNFISHVKKDREKKKRRRAVDLTVSFFCFGLLAAWGYIIALDALDSEVLTAVCSNSVTPDTICYDEAENPNGWRQFSCTNIGDSLGTIASGGAFGSDQRGQSVVLVNDDRFCSNVVGGQVNTTMRSRPLAYFVEQRVAKDGTCQRTGSTSGGNQQGNTNSPQNSGGGNPPPQNGGGGGNPPTQNGGGGRRANSQQSALYGAVADQNSQEGYCNSNPGCCPDDGCTCYRASTNVATPYTCCGYRGLTLYERFLAWLAGVGGAHALLAILAGFLSKIFSKCGGKKKKRKQSKGPASGGELELSAENGKDTGFRGVISRSAI